MRRVVEERQGQEAAGGGGGGGEGEREERREAAEERLLPEPMLMPLPPPPPPPPPPEAANAPAVPAGETDEQKRLIVEGRELAPEQIDGILNGLCRWRRVAPDTIPTDAMREWIELNHYFLRHMKPLAQTLILNARPNGGEAENDADRQEREQAADTAWAGLQETWMTWTATVLIPLPGKRQRMGERIAAAVNRLRGAEAAGHADRKREALVAEAKRMIEEERVRLASKPPRVRAAETEAEQARQALRRRVRQLIRAGRMGKAATLLHQDGRVAPANTNTMRELAKVNPQGEELLEIDDAGRAPPRPIEFTKRDIQSVPRRVVDDGTSSGADGINGALLYPIMMADATAEAIALIFTVIAQNLVRDGPLADTLRTATMTPLEKDTGGVRPIAVGQTLMKICSKLCLRIDGMAEAIQAAFPEVQRGVSTPSGIERNIVELQTEWDRRKRAGQVPALIGFDAVNAFGARFRREMLESLAASSAMLRQLLPITQFICRRPSPLLVYNDGQLAGSLSNSQGVRQGEPISPLLFSLSVQEVFTNTVAAAGEGSKGGGCIDDLAIVTTIDGALDSLDYLVAHAPGGFALNRKKTELLLPLNVELTPAQQQRITDAGITVKYGAMRVTGGLVGDMDEESVGTAWNNMAEGELRATRRFAERVDTLKLPPQEAYQLIKQCWTTRHAFMVRMIPPQIAQHRLHEKDGIIFDLFANTVGISHVERNKTQVRLQAKQPVSSGGLGITPAEDTSSLAFLAARLSIIALHGIQLANEMEGTPQLAAMETAWERTMTRIRDDCPSMHRYACRILGLGRQLADANPPLRTVIARVTNRVHLAQIAEQVASEEAQEGHVRQRQLGMMVWKAVHNNTEYQAAAENVRVQWERQEKEAAARNDRVSKLKKQIARWNAPMPAAGAEAPNDADPRLTIAAILKIIRFQHIFSRMVAEARTVRMWTEAVQQMHARRLPAHKPEMTTAMIWREAQFAYTQARIQAQHWAAVTDPTAGWLFRAVPTTPETTIAEGPFRAAIRARLMLKPQPNLQHCPQQRHRGWPVSQRNGLNNMFNLDYSHDSVCERATQIGGARTKRHNRISATIREEGSKANCATINEPGIAELLQVGAFPAAVEAGVLAEVQPEVEAADPDPDEAAGYDAALAEAAANIAPDEEEMEMAGDNEEAENEEEVEAPARARKDDRKEADIFINGVDVTESHVVDVRVTAPSSIPNQMAYAGRCSRLTKTPDMTIRPLLLSHEASKRRSYANAVQAMLAAANDDRHANYNPQHESGPLYIADMKLVAAIATPLGNVSPQFDTLLQDIAKKAATSDIHRMGLPQNDRMHSALRASHINRIRCSVAVAIADANFINLQTFFTANRGARKKRR